MSLYLRRFGATYAGATVLPDGLATQNVMPDAMTPSMIKLPGGGVFNPWGTDEALPQGTILVARGAYTAADRATLLGEVDELRAWNGKTSNLYISITATTYRERKARMWCDDQPVTPHSLHGFWQPMTLTFELEDTIWHGDDGTDTIDVTQDNSFQAKNITNEGNGIVRTIILTYTVAGAGDALTKVVIENKTSGYICKIQVEDVVALGDDLVINCGAKTVTNNGNDAFEHFSIETGHSRTEWFVLGPDVNAIRVTRSAGNAADVLTLAFRDAHK